MDITEIAVGLIGLCGLVITGVVIPYIRSKMTLGQWENITAWTKSAVQAAEILFNAGGKGAEKRKYVDDFVRRMCSQNGVKYDHEAVRIALEDAWSGMGG